MLKEHASVIDILLYILQKTLVYRDEKDIYPLEARPSRLYSSDLFSIAQTKSSRS
jgi:hypothetical protein